MRLHYLQHVPFEGPANIAAWAGQKGWEITGSHLYRGAPLPSPDDLDWLVIMGGPMNVYEESSYPWLAAEKDFIRDSVRKGKVVIGICLGAQLISAALGGSVVRNGFKEIGWYAVELLPEARSSTPFQGLADSFVAFHWHGDACSIPPGAVMLARSKACPAQAFSMNEGRVLGLQFHLESSPESVRLLIENCGNELVPGEYIQDAEAILKETARFETIRASMDTLLHNMAVAFSPGK
ncbi:MAG: type 1 glutamine amidotransferase [Desulfobacteraceae bacterium]|nr:type 1 glutamine amidotransferase [Desulfobacteraceae bacterium]